MGIYYIHVPLQDDKMLQWSPVFTLNDDTMLEWSTDITWQDENVLGWSPDFTKQDRNMLGWSQLFTWIVLQNGGLEPELYVMEELINREFPETRFKVFPFSSMQILNVCGSNF